MERLEPDGRPVFKSSRDLALELQAHFYKKAPNLHHLTEDDPRRKKRQNVRQNLRNTPNKRPKPNKLDIIQHQN